MFNRKFDNAGRFSIARVTVKVVQVPYKYPTINQITWDQQDRKRASGKPLFYWIVDRRDRIVEQNEQNSTNDENDFKKRKQQN